MIFSRMLVLKMNAYIFFPPFIVIIPLAYYPQQCLCNFPPALILHFTHSLHSVYTNQSRRMHFSLCFPLYLQVNLFVVLLSACQLEGFKKVSLYRISARRQHMIFSCVEFFYDITLHNYACVVTFDLIGVTELCQQFCESQQAYFI